jgi:hypothetical protein
MTRSSISVAVLGLAAALSGCSPGVPFDDPTAEYTQRSLTISPTTGNAQAANLAIQTSTPWPRNSWNTRIPGNGPLMVNAVETYQSGPGGGTPSSAAGGAATGAAAGGPSATPSPPPAPPAN